jgi:hypothetical protein
MTMRFQAFLAGFILLAAAVVAVAANAVADQREDIAKTERRVGDSQLADTSVTLSSPAGDVVVATTTD